MPETAPSTAKCVQIWVACRNSIVGTWLHPQDSWRNVQSEPAGKGARKQASLCSCLDFKIKPHPCDWHLLTPLNQGLVRLFFSKGKVQPGQSLLWPYPGSQTGCLYPYEHSWWQVTLFHSVLWTVEQCPSHSCFLSLIQEQIVLVPPSCSTFYSYTFLFHLLLIQMWRMKKAEDWGQEDHRASWALLLRPWGLA